MLFRHLKKPVLRSRPLIGDVRRIKILNFAEPLGIQISGVDSGGVFVSLVDEQSLAFKVGLLIGDQVLEVCGINMRKATCRLALNVMQQCGNYLVLLVKYSPDSMLQLIKFFFEEVCTYIFFFQNTWNQKISNVSLITHMRLP